MINIAEKQLYIVITKKAPDLTVRDNCLLKKFGGENVTILKIIF